MQICLKMFHKKLYQKTIAIHSLKQNIITWGAREELKPSKHSKLIRALSITIV